MMRYATKNPHLERRFLVADAAVIGTATEPPQAIRQAYLATGKRTIRLRVAGASAWLTVRDPRQARGGFQYSIPIADAEDMMQRLAATPIVVKDRYRIEDGAAWTVDVFKGDNAPACGRRSRPRFARHGHQAAGLARRRGLQRSALPQRLSGPASLFHLAGFGSTMASYFVSWTFRFRGKTDRLRAIVECFLNEPDKGLSPAQIGRASGIAMYDAVHILDQTPELFVKLPGPTRRHHPLPTRFFRGGARRRRRRGVDSAQRPTRILALLRPADDCAAACHSSGAGAAARAVLRKTTLRKLPKGLRDARTTARRNRRPARPRGRAGSRCIGAAARRRLAQRQ